MTTREAAASYEAQHLAAHAGKGYAVFNPHQKPIADLPVIYGFNNGGPPGLLSAVLIAQDGTALGNHCCSSEGYMRHDLGITEGSRLDRHESFSAHYPDGYRMDFVEGHAVLTHAGLNAAIAAYHAKAEAAANVAAA